MSSLTTNIVSQTYKWKVRGLGRTESQSKVPKTNKKVTTKKKKGGYSMENRGCRHLGSKVYKPYLSTKS